MNDVRQIAPDDGVRIHPGPIDAVAVDRCTASRVADHGVPPHDGVSPDHRIAPDDALPQMTALPQITALPQMTAVVQARSFV